MRLNNVLRKTQHILAFTALLGLAGCATTRPRHVWKDEALEAENRQAEGELDVAQRAYVRLLPDAPTDADRRWLEYNLARIELERGNHERAVAMLEDLYTAQQTDRFGADAMFDVAKLRDSDELRWKVVRRFPSEVAAEFAIDQLVRTHRGESAQDLEKNLKDVHEDVTETEVDDNILFALADVRRNELRDPDGALEAYRTLYSQDPDGPLADDALWEMAAIYREHQRWQPAVELLEILASDTESSWFVGIYRSEWVDDAVYDLGWIHLVWLDDVETARRWFKRYLKRYPDAVWADDAAWQLVEAERLRGEAEDYRRALQKFQTEWPESRHARVAKRRLGRDG